MNFQVTRGCIYDFIRDIINLQLIIRGGPGGGLAMKSVALGENRQIVWGVESSCDFGLGLGVGFTCLGFAR